MVGSLTSKRKTNRTRRAINASGRVPNGPKTKKPKREKIRLMFSCLTSANGGVAISLSKKAKETFVRMLAEKGFEVEFSEANGQKLFATEIISDMVCHACRDQNVNMARKATRLLHYRSAVGYAGYIPVCEKHKNLP